jgi:hypothetical protein
MKITPAKTILAFVFICLIGFALFVYYNPDGPFAYGRFHLRSSEYYSQLAHDCDSLLKQHQTFSKHPTSQELKDSYAFWMDTNNVLWEDNKVSVNDPSLPKIIRSLHPHEILIEPKRVLIEIGFRPNFVIIWGESDTRTNVWTLATDGEGLETALYSEVR